MIEILASVAAVIFCLFIIFVFIIAGWAFIWNLFLKKFTFVQELMGVTDANAQSEETVRNSQKKTRSRKQRMDD